MDQKMRIAILILWLGIFTTTFRDGLAEKRVVCYYTNWSVYRPGTAKFSPQNINPYLCTHLIYAFGGFTKDNTLKPFDKYQDIEKGGYAKFTGLKTYNKNLKTMLAIGGWNEGSSRFSPMVADAKRRKEFVKNCVKFLRQNHFDGLDLDWEYPAFRDGGKPRDKNNYANLVQELREQFEREASKTGRPRLLLTMAIPAGIEYLEKGYDIPKLDEYLDFFNLLSYDYHSAYEPSVNHHAPLYALEEDNEYNYDSELTIDYTIKYLIRQGASADKIVLGIPTYGRSYTLINEDATEIGSPSDGPGIEGDATREKGYLAYYEICEGIENDEWQVEHVNPNAIGPYAFKGNQWVGYDDEDIVRKKALYVNENNLGGIMFWSIDNDDFRGKCHGKPYPLIEAAKESLITNNIPKSENRKATSTSKKESKDSSAQSNSVSRKFSAGNRRSTAPPETSRTKPEVTRHKSRQSHSDEEDEKDDEVVNDDDEEEEEDEEDRNVVKKVEKQSRPRSSAKPRFRNRSNGRKQTRKTEEKQKSNDNLSNKFTTPEPPTTPDPGSDFKCEDEGFFPHPRDCKKYFWCLDSGPSGLGVVAHQFTCPSGLVFNKAADSCDYPRNVICPKVKSSSATTKAPATTARSVKKTTTEAPEPEPESEEEYEYEDEKDVSADKKDDSEDVKNDSDEEEELEDEEEEEPVKPKKTVTPKTLLYKTISRNRPTTEKTTTTTTTEPSTTTTVASRSLVSSVEKEITPEIEEDPKVIKELIELIKKAGGIEQLERQLQLQGKNSSVSPGLATPATISRSLYERVLNRQNTKKSSISPPQKEEPKTSKSNERTNSNRFRYVNGPGRSQFEGLDEVQEVKSLRRTSKPQYVTIERDKNKNSKQEEEEKLEDAMVEEQDSEYEDNNEEVPLVAVTTKKPVEEKVVAPKVTPSYSNIRRTRPSSPTRTTPEVNAEVSTEKPSFRRRRPSIKQSSDGNNVDETRHTQSVENVKNVAVSEENATTAKSRYASISRFRKTTLKPVRIPEDSVPEEVHSSTASVTPIIDFTTSQPKIARTESSISSSVSSSTLPLSIPTYLYSTVTTQSESTPRKVEPTENYEDTVVKHYATTPDSRLVEDSATEILLTTADISASKVTVAAVSQPRPFGFPRRNRLNQSSTTPVPELATESTRPKVTDTELKNSQLPTLKEIVAQARQMFWANKSYTKNETTLRIETEEGWIWLENQKSFQEIVDNTLTIKRNAANKTLTTSTSQSTIYGTRSNRRRTKDKIFTARPRSKYQRNSKRRRQRIYILGPRRHQKKTQNETTIPDIIITTASTTPLPIKSSSLIGFFITKNPKSIIENTPIFTTTQVNNEVTEPSVTDEIMTTDYLEIETQTDHPTETNLIIGQMDTTEIIESKTDERTTSDSSGGTTEMPNITLKDEEEDGSSELTVQSSATLQESKKEETGLEKTGKSGKSIEAKEGERRQNSNSLPKKDDHQMNSEANIYKTNVRRSGIVNNKRNIISDRSSADRLRRPDYPDTFIDEEPQTTGYTNDESILLVNLNDAEVHRIDQSSRAQEPEVAIADPPEPNSTTSPDGKPSYRTTLHRKISTTAIPRFVTVTTSPPMSTVSILKRRQGLKYNSDKATTAYVQRRRQPAIIDYDYYEDDEVPIIGKPILNGKLYVTGKGAIRCLDQGNFPHPISCKKFITCSKMVNGLVTGTEYTCPAKLSFDPVGGICNWAAGLGCDE